MKAQKTVARIFALHKTKACITFQAVNRSFFTAHILVILFHNIGIINIDFPLGILAISFNPANWFSVSIGTDESSSFVLMPPHNRQLVFVTDGLTERSIPLVSF